MDSSAARNMMVDSQIRPNKVTDRRIIDAMRQLPRENFVPPASRALAYADEDVPLGNGRVMLEPMVIARLVQLAAVQPGERVLVVACGTGYGAALLAACGAVVTAVDDDAGLLARARAAGGAGVTIVEGDTAAGWPSGGPYDAVLVEGAIAHVPPALAAQVKRPGGRLVAVLRGEGKVGQAVCGMPAGEGLSFRTAFDCGTALLPAFRQVPGFVF